MVAATCLGVFLLLPPGLCSSEVVPQALDTTPPGASEIQLTVPSQTYPVDHEMELIGLGSILRGVINIAKSGTTAATNPSALSVADFLRTAGKLTWLLGASGGPLAQVVRGTMQVGGFMLRTFGSSDASQTQSGDPLHDIVRVVGSGFDSTNHEQQQMLTELRSQLGLLHKDNQQVLEILKDDLANLEAAIQNVSAAVKDIQNAQSMILEYTHALYEDERLGKQKMDAISADFHEMTQRFHDAMHSPEDLKSLERYVIYKSDKWSSEADDRFGAFGTHNIRAFLHDLSSRNTPCGTAMRFQEVVAARYKLFWICWMGSVFDAHQLTHSSVRYARSLRDQISAYTAIIEETEILEFGKAPYPALTFCVQKCGSFGHDYLRLLACGNLTFTQAANRKLQKQEGEIVSKLPPHASHVQVLSLVGSGLKMINGYFSVTGHMNGSPYYTQWGSVLKLYHNRRCGEFALARWIITASMPVSGIGGGCDDSYAYIETDDGDKVPRNSQWKVAGNDGGFHDAMLQFIVGASPPLLVGPILKIPEAAGYAAGSYNFFGFTAIGAPFYKHASKDYIMFFDPSCDGSWDRLHTPSRWMLRPGSEHPSLTRHAKLFDSGCDALAHLPSSISCGLPSNTPWSVQEPERRLTVERGHCSYDGNCVTSAHYPGLYDNYDRCTIEAQGFFSVVDFHTETNFDVLTVDGERYSGDLVFGHVLRSAASIHWSTDGSGVRNGWKLCPHPSDALVVVEDGAMGAAEQTTLQLSGAAQSPAFAASNAASSTAAVCLVVVAALGAISCICGKSLVNAPKPSRTLSEPFLRSEAS